MIASPAFKSTARSGNIAPRHLSQIVMLAVYHDGKWKHIHLKYWVLRGDSPFVHSQLGHRTQRAVGENPVEGQLNQSAGSLTEVIQSHRIVAYEA